MRLPPTNSNSPVEHRTPITPKPRAPWILLLPLLLGAGIVWQQTRDTPQPQDTTTARVRQRPIRKPAPQATPKSAEAPKPAIQYSIPTTILVPEDDEKLHAKPWKALPSGAPAGQNIDLKDLHTRWMNAVVQATPELFPPGTRVKSVEVGSVREPAQVDFNAAFAKPDFWNGELKTQMAVYSIVNTLSPVMSGKGRNVPVQILVEGKRIETLGEFDASDAIEPDFSLNAKGATGISNAANAANLNTTSNVNNAVNVDSDTEGRANP